MIFNSFEIDLCGDGTSHSGGDYFVMDTLYRLMNNNKIENMPSFNEAIKATHICLLIEKSAELNKKMHYIDL